MGSGGWQWAQDPLPGMTRKEITELGVLQVQNSIVSIDEVREKLDLPPWGIPETSEPIVFTAQGPVPLSMAPQLVKAAAEGADQRKRIEKLERLVRLLTDWNARSEEITKLRRELGL